MCVDDNDEICKITCADKPADQTHGHRLNSISGFSDLHRRLSVTSQTNGLSMLPFTPFAGDNRAAYFGNVAPKFSANDLPDFIKPLPVKIGPDEVAYLEKKGALTVPKGTLRNEILRAYIEFVHPYMPLLDLHDFLTMIDRPDTSLGKVSLILFQAVMFAGSAFIDMHHLRTAGYVTRKEARKDFFQKTRVSSISFHGFSVVFGRPSNSVFLRRRFVGVSDSHMSNTAQLSSFTDACDTTNRFHSFFTTLTTNRIGSLLYKRYSS